MGREKVNCSKVRTACEVMELAEISEIDGKKTSLFRQCAEMFQRSVVNGVPHLPNKVCIPVPQISFLPSRTP